MLSLSITYYICLFTELLYPTYCSLKAIQSTSKIDDTQWLTYWVVYAIFSTMEGVGKFFLGWIPLYYEIKLLFVIWMIAPQTQGARKIYEDHIVPMLKKYGHKIDPIFGQADAVLKSSLVNQIAISAEKHAPGLAEQALKQRPMRPCRTKASATTIVASGTSDSDPAPDSAGMLRYQLDLLRRMVSFLGPATLIPLGEPLMSLVDTVCIGQFAGTSQLAALGPANLVFSFCQYFLQSLQVATLRGLP
ncbi:hypothetical protein VOLCADRAFT_103098 [Volvox carteri f. nagariensis]|uniref:HVA22-like protein n=1 Tax=Volvox carteri f. nagariensis TaxID=3068 RepID=D8TKM5_VOLCA|nr:uncharacterized protein VOLCADRAFT_103098 [Volvox carteri f. nagariensis]EFJ51912.1 hypothetical protein VOLCADRAFT_103098 [Volvox carteri f. nagariensis]|eukprot:XP_002946686.1 hypothetical protein VOLCADRAFT_103098 [Volvox carteri f. nagariensis]